MGLVLDVLSDDDVLVLGVVDVVLLELLLEEVSGFLS